MADNDHDKYLFFSSQELISYFLNNLKEKDIKTQCKRIFEMARVFMAKKDFAFEDIYSVAVMVRDIKDCPQIDEVFKLYFKQDRFPIKVIIQIDEIEDVSDIEMEFCAYKGEKKFINTSQAVIIENFIHTSGIGPLKLDTLVPIEEDLEHQVRQCIGNLQVILHKSGSSLEQVYSILMYMKDISLLPQIEEIFAEYCFQEDISQRVIQVKKLAKDYDIEISCSANLNN